MKNKDNLNNFILNRLNELRQNSGISINKIAQKANISQSTTFNAFSGKGTTSTYTLSALCKAFDITMCEFFSNFEERYVLNENEFVIISLLRSLSDTEREFILNQIRCYIDFVNGKNNEEK